MGLGPAMLGLSQGVGAGLQLGQQIRGQLDAGETRSAVSDAQAQAAQDAQSQQDAALANSIVPVAPDPNAAPVDPNDPTQAQPQGYVVNGVTYPDQFSARAAAQKATAGQTPSAQDLFTSKYSNGVTQALLAQGKPEQAQQFQDWSRQQAGQQAMKGYGMALAGFSKDADGNTQINHDQVVNGLKMANQAIPNGVDISDVQPTGDKAGTVTVTGTQNGQPFTRVMTKDELYQQGMALADPHAAFQNYGAQMIAGAQFGRDYSLEQLKQTGAVQAARERGVDAAQVDTSGKLGVARVDQQTKLALPGVTSAADLQTAAGKAAIDNGTGAKFAPLIEQAGSQTSTLYAAPLREASAAVSQAQQAATAAPGDANAQAALATAQANLTAVQNESTGVGSTASSLIPLLHQQNPQVGAKTAVDIAQKVQRNDPSVKYNLDSATGGVIRSVTSGGKNYYVDAEAAATQTAPPEVQRDLVNKFGPLNPVTKAPWDFSGSDATAQRQGLGKEAIEAAQAVAAQQGPKRVLPGANAPVAAPNNQRYLPQL